MKNIYFLALVLSSFFVTSAYSQTNDSWKILMNKQLLLQTPVESNEPVIRINKSATLKKNTITIKYTSADAGSDMKRSFFINDASEKTYKKLELKNADGTVTFNTQELKALAAANKPLFIYTTAIPKDPNVAMLVRVRRLLICKIEWK